MSMQSKLKVRGIFMVVSFFALLGIIFSPVFPGKMNGLDYMDNLFNMISKGSSYFIPQSLVESEKFADKALETKIKLANEKEAAEIAKLFAASGAQVDVAGVELNIKGNVGQIMKTALEDADMLFNNNGKPLVDKYGYDEKRVIFNWWTACSKISKYLTAEKRFDGANLFENIKKPRKTKENYFL